MAEEVRLDLVAKVDKAISEIESLKGAINDSAEATKDAAKSTDGLAKGFKGVGLAIKTAGIGLILGALSKLKELIEQNQLVTDALSGAFNTVSVVFNEVVEVVIDIYNAVSESSEGFDALGKVLKNVMTLSLTPMKVAFYGIKLGIQNLQLAWEKSPLGGGDEGKIAELTASINDTKDALKEVATDGLDAVKGIKDNVVEAVTEVVEGVTIAYEVGKEGISKIDIESAIATGKAMTEAKKNAELLEILRAKQQLQSQLDAETQRQIRDDVTKSFEDRIKANDKLGEILEDQIKKEKEFADEKVANALREWNANKSNAELEAAYNQALLEQLDIEERVAGQKSEQMTNTNGLLQEQKDAMNELALIGMTHRQVEEEELTQWYKQKLDLARKSGQDTTNIEKEFAKRKGLIAQGERDAKIEAASQVVGALGQLAGDNKAFAVAGATIDTYAAIVGQLRAFSGLPIPGYAIAQAVATGLVGLSNVRKILQTEVPNGGGGGGSAPSGISSVGGNIAASIPAATGLGDVVDSINGQANQPVEAFVIAQNVTDSQEAQSYINNQRTL